MTFLNFLDNVRGCVLDIKKIHSSLLFDNPSDALVSSLFVKYVDAAGVPLSLFDDLLALFRHADFRADEVTFKKSEDIMDRIADGRRAIAIGRTLIYEQKAESHPATLVQTSTLLPELLAEYIDSQRVPFHQSIRIDREYYYRPVGWEVDYMLNSLALVHRSWTNVARRYLQRRINIIGQKMLRSMYQIPQIGPNVRELSFRGSTSDSSYRHVSTKEMTRLLCGIFERCPNITNLYLENFHVSHSSAFLTSQLDKTSTDVIGHIAGLESLEHLGLLQARFSGAGRENIERLCTILPGLRSLKSLSLANWDLRKEFAGLNEPINILDLPQTTCPPATLSSVSLTGVDINSGILSWLTKSRGNGVTTLRLCRGDMIIERRVWLGDQDQDQDLEYLRPHLKKGLEHVIDLQLVELPSPHELLFLLQFFPSLQSFSIVINSFFGGSLPDSFVLPDSIQNLHFHLKEVPKEDQDIIVQGILQANPHLRRMSITYSSDRYYSTELPSQLSLKDTIHYCERNHVVFKVTRMTDEVPHYLYP